jgi:hypothetical protein
VHRGDVPVRQGPGDGDRLAGGHQLLALQPGVDQVDHMVRQRGQVGDGLVLDRAAVPVGAPQVRRGVVLAVALLVHVAGLRDSDYVNFTGVPRHTQTITVFRCGTSDKTSIHSDYVLCPDVTVSAVQEATPTKSYGNFGLASDAVTSMVAVEAAG